MSKRPLLHYETLYLVLFNSMMISVKCSINNNINIEWLLVGRNGVEFEDIEMFIQTGDTIFENIGIDKYMKEVKISYMYVDRLSSELQEHISNVATLRTAFYGTILEMKILKC